MEVDEKRIGRANRRIEGGTQMGTVIIILLILFLIGAVPRWPYSRNWGFSPSGLLGIVLLVVIVLVLTGRL